MQLDTHHNTCPELPNGEVSAVLLNVASLVGWRF